MHCAARFDVMGNLEIFFGFQGELNKALEGTPLANLNLQTYGTWQPQSEAAIDEPFRPPNSTQTTTSSTS
jgi:hypothetical protein